MSVDINEKIVLWLWSPGSFLFYFRAAIFENTSFSRTPLVSAFEDCLNVDYCWNAENFNNFFIGKMPTPQNCGGGGGLVRFPPYPLPHPQYLLSLRSWHKISNTNLFIVTVNLFSSTYLLIFSHFISFLYIQWIWMNEFSHLLVPSFVFNFNSRKSKQKWIIFNL